MQSNRFFKRFTLSTLSLAILVAGSALADVKVVTGPSPIEGDVLIHPEDITLYNDKIAITFAVGSPNFWGMTNGSISNLALMQGRDQFGVNIVNDVEFLVNSWTASGGSLVADVEVVKASVEEGIVRATSTWLGDGKDNALDVVTTYTLTKDSNVLQLHTLVTNPGPDSYEDLRSGYSLSALSAFMFGPFGYDTPDIRARNIYIGAGADEPLGDFTVSYTEDYAITVQMDDPDIYRGTTGYKDLHKHYNLAPGESMAFTGELQIADVGHTSPFMARMIEKKGLASSTISGVVYNDQGEVHASPVIVVEREGRYKGEFVGAQNVGSDQLHVNMQPLFWHVGDADGAFSFQVPEGEYQIYALDAGFTPSQKQSISVTAGEQQSLSFKDEYAIVQGGVVLLNISDTDTGEPVDARIEVEGEVPAVKYLGRRTYFTELDEVGVARIQLATGEFAFNVLSGAHFNSMPVRSETTVRSNEVSDVVLSVKSDVLPNQEGWYAVDFHHHTDIGDANTPPVDVVRSQLASRLDLTYISDHDAVSNHSEVHDLSLQRGYPFIPGLEVTPGWGHFNLINMPINHEVIDSSMDVADIIKAAHEMGALVIVNHPFSDYGYFNNRDIVPGGYSPDFDLIELQPTLDLSKPDNIDTRTLTQAMRFWDESLTGDSKVYYLTGGTDTHEVTSPTLYSGIIRTLAKVDDDLTVEGFVDAVAAGRSYVSMGPMMFTQELEFGQTYEVTNGEALSLAVELFAVNGLESVELYTSGSEIGSPLETRSLESTEGRQKVEFSLQPAQNTWYNLIVKDKSGRPAISNPIWVNVKG
ncbi:MULTISPECIES: CehA/McbA family metallohydrolase [Nitrincola]|uniref:Polymerase/histidinol phosphatase N-terminal domain-containing protein n=1 Tax=Nitrincola nitratireducens TaxID=1229521 RepID=W9V7Z6_9GAMM|nr:MULTISPECIES: CehA/McbA family metallohydrolase [Nitrincola]EXJ12212.1 hypothetical protein D791_01101 [Nitrincola nitratireducens]